MRSEQQGQPEAEKRGHFYIDNKAALVTQNRYV